MQKLDDELHRGFIVVMKDYLEIAGLGVNIAFNIALNIAHGIYPLNYSSFRHVALDRDAKLEQNKNNVTTPTCKNMKGGPRAAGIQPSSNSPPARASASVQIRSRLNQA